MWKQFYFSSDFDLLILGLLILIIVGIIVGLKLYFDSLHEKKKQTQLMEQTLRSFETLSQLVQGDTNMKFNIDDILAGHQSTTNPTQADAISKDITSALGSMTRVSAAMAGNVARIAVNTGLRQQTTDLNDLSDQFAQVAEILASKTAQEGQQSAAIALGETTSQQALAENSADPQQESSDNATAIEQEDVPILNNSYAEAVNEESPFTIDDLRTLIRNNDCLSHAYHISNPGQSIGGVFEIRDKDAKSLINILCLKEKQGKLAEIHNGERALNFLQEEYTPAS